MTAHHRYPRLHDTFGFEQFETVLIFFPWPGDLDDGTDFDGMMWGGGGGFATQPTKKSINENAVIRKSESEPVSLQPKSQTSTATVVTQAPSSRSAQ